MTRRAPPSLAILLLAAGLLVACGTGEDPAREKAEVLEGLDATIEQLVALSADACAEGMVPNDAAVEEIQALIAKARTLRDLAQECPLDELRSRARAVAFDAGDLGNLWRVQVETQRAERGRAASEARARELEEERKASSAYARRRAEVLNVYRRATAELEALSQTAAEGATSTTGLQDATGALTAAHRELERTEDLSRSSRSSEALAALLTAREAIDGALRLLAEERSERDRQAAAREHEGGPTTSEHPERTVQVEDAAVQAREERPEPAREPPAPAASAEELFRSHAPSVVAIHTYDRLHRPVSQGTGFFVTSGGRIVTNQHVIDAAHSGVVVRQDGTKLPVTRILAEDQREDLALIQVHTRDAPILELGDDDRPAIGSKVFAIGNPRGLTNTLSEGIISGHRVFESGAERLQTTAPISPGSSGGPLLSERGRVVGVVSAFFRDGQNLNLAIPVPAVKNLLARRSRARILGRPGATPSLYAAIAFSRSTGRYGYAHDQTSKLRAESEARKAANARDARVVVWARDAWCVLAVGNDGRAFGAAIGSTRSEAMATALQECQKHATDSRVVVAFHADSTRN